MTLADTLIILAAFQAEQPQAPTVEDSEDFPNYGVVTTPDSTAMQSVAYDATRRVLTINFRRSGAYYAYREVPLVVVMELLTAESKGTYFREWIKGKYQLVNR